MMLKEKETGVSSTQIDQTPILQNSDLASLGGGGAETMLPQIQEFSAAMEIDQIHADPTTDTGFKMLLNKDKEILISIINSLLDFEGDNEIVELEVNSNENLVDILSNQKGQSGIVTIVDILCTNRGKHKIAIEMQRQKEKYFLAREQFYMAKLIANQVKEGQSKLYHEAILETYIIVIGKGNIFTGETSIRDKKLFEIDVKPMIVKTGEIYPDNKMNWRFFELPKFRESDKYKDITKTSPIKYQWLGFLIDCSHEAVKLDREKIIQKGCKIMEIATWPGDKQTLYWKEKANERAAQQILRESFEEGMQKGIQEGMQKGKQKEAIKSDIFLFKTLKKLGIAIEKIITELKLLTHPKVVDKLESNLEYIENHMDDTESVICDALGLYDALWPRDDSLS